MTAQPSSPTRYTFRFESAHSDGRRVTHTTTLLGRSEAEGRAKLAALLGSNRYEIVLLEQTPAAASAPVWSSERRSVPVPAVLNRCR